MYRSVCLFLLSFCLLACRPESTTEAPGEEPVTVQLSCEPLGVPTDSAYAVYAQVGDSRVKLFEWANCQTAGDSDSLLYGSYEGRAFTLAAVAQSPPDWIFRLVPTDSDTIGPIDAAAYRSGRFQFLHPLSPIDLNGRYGCQQRDSAFVLEINRAMSGISVQLYQKAGLLPEQLDNYELEAQFEVRPLPDFEVALIPLRFQSSIGAGAIDWSLDSTRLVFDRFRGEERVVFRFLDL